MGVKMKVKLFFIIIFIFSSFGYSQKINKELLNALNQIDSIELKAHVLFLADDLLQGRKSGSFGEKVATQYIARQFQSYGLKPGVDNGKSYFQEMTLVGVEMNNDMVLKAYTKDKSIDFNFYTEFIGFSGIREKEIKIQDADVIFAGYGIEAPEYEWNDYKNIDMKGKVLLIINNDPSKDPKLFEGKKRLYYGRWDYKFDKAAKKGALGAIIIHTDESAGYGWQVIQSSWVGEQFDLKDNKSPKVKLQGWLTKEASQKLVSLGGFNLDDLFNKAESRDFYPINLGIKISIEMKSSVREVNTRNVIGILEGSDKKLKDEAVVYTSHFDHLGIGKAINNDSIYNGALDNATGISSLITMAKAFNSLKVKPKRTIIFIATAGEEEGLLGSDYFVQNPTYPLDKIIACINIDAVNIFGEPKNIEIIGGEHSNLFKIVDEEARKLNMYAVMDQNPEQGSFYRSDQFNFAKVGIPSIYISNGEDFVGKPKGWGSEIMEKWSEKNYHQPSDEVEPWWDFNGMSKNVKVFFLSGYRLANEKSKPQWKSSSEFFKLRN